MAEVWKTIPSFPVYEASSSGQIRSLYRVLTPVLGDDGYYSVTVYKGGAGFTRRVHVLVCEAFHGPRPMPGMEVAHNSGTKANNRPGNLRWAFPKGNAADRIKHGTQVHGADHPNALFTERQVEIIRQCHRARPTIAEVARLAEAFMVSPRTIRDIVMRRTWNTPTVKRRRRWI